MRPQLCDEQLTRIKAMPASNTTAVTGAIDLGNVKGDFLALCQVYMAVEAMTTGQLGDAATHKFDLIHSDNADLSSSSDLITTIADMTQTGAGGAGAAAKSFRTRLPTHCKRYIGLKTTKSANTDASAKKMTLKLEF